MAKGYGDGHETKQKVKLTVKYKFKLLTWPLTCKVRKQSENLHNLPIASMHIKYDKTEIYEYQHKIIWVENETNLRIKYN